MVTDKGYHSDGVLERLDEEGIRGYLAEPDRGRRSWTGPDGKARQKRLYSNQLLRTGFSTAAA